ncbi:unnamed protein product [Cuscuta campestris]|uniref:F-box domain-containing protein n=1 Tax=Cuscuta campestris TaxID=132261 RepID=A0A484LXT4_9ASTE|nr:unnamed protein product [Cuscuta campestris]
MLKSKGSTLVMLWLGVQALHQQLLQLVTSRKVQVKGKRPVENPSSASTIAASGRKAQVNGKHPSVESSSSASTITDMVVEEKDYVTRPLESIRSILLEDTDVIDTKEAPQSPYYVDESGYPPEAEREYIWEEDHFVAKVSRRARDVASDLSSQVHTFRVKNLKGKGSVLLRIQALHQQLLIETLKSKRKHPCDALAGSSSSASATVATGRKVQVKGKRPVENPSSASTIAASGRKAQVKGKHPSVESSSSASTITDMVVEEKDYVARHLESLRSIFSEDMDVIDTKKAPQSPYYVDASGYPPPEAEWEYIWEEDRFVAKVCRRARENFIMAALEELPIEMLFLILLQLDMFELLLMKLVSTYFKKVMEQGLSLEFFREYNLNGREQVWFFSYIHHNMARICHRVAAVREGEDGRRKRICLTLKGMGDEDMQ